MEFLGFRIPPAFLFRGSHMELSHRFRQTTQADPNRQTPSEEPCQFWPECFAVPPVGGRLSGAMGTPAVVRLCEDVQRLGAASRVFIDIAASECLRLAGMARLA